MVFEKIKNDGFKVQVFVVELIISNPSLFLFSTDLLRWFYFTSKRKFYIKINELSIKYQVII